MKIKLCKETNKLIINNAAVDLPFKANEIHVSRNKVVVLFEYMEKRESFSNIWAYDFEGKKLWEVQLPISKPGHFANIENRQQRNKLEKEQKLLKNNEIIETDCFLSNRKYILLPAV